MFIDMGTTLCSMEHKHLSTVDAGTSSGSIEVRAPAWVGSIACLRSVAASVASRLDFPLDELEDLRLAINEACAYLLRTYPGAADLRLSIAPLPDSVGIVVSVSDDQWRAPPEDAQQWMIWHVLGALTDEARLEYGPNGPFIRFTKRVAR